MDFRKLGEKIGKIAADSSIVKTGEKLRKVLDIDSVKIAHQVSKAINGLPIADIHTHTYSGDFGDLLLWGIDELLTYHYLIAEFFRYQPSMEYEKFWAMSKQQQAQAIWDELFVKNTPISEATRGVVTVLNKLGIDTADKNLSKIRKYFADIKTSDYINRVFELANLKWVVMTNDPFDKAEIAVWNNGGNSDERFKAALRIDGLVNNFDRCCDKISAQGFEIKSGKIKEGTISTVKDFLRSWVEKIEPVYIAASFEDDFRVDDGSDRAKLIKECVIPVAKEFGLPFAMMIGVKRAVNPDLRLAGDGVGKADIDVVSQLAREYPDVRFLVTMLSRENQHELCITARKFKNLMIFGCWWFLNNPSIIREMTAERIETLGLSMIPQHSDARVLDQLIYKWEHSRRIIGEVLTEKYCDLAETGWVVSEQDIRRDIERILGGGLLAQG